MANPEVIIVDAQTGQQEIREMTDEEYAAYLAFAEQVENNAQQ